MEASNKRIFRPLPLLFLGVALGLGWALMPLWQSTSQLSEGLRVCTERVNLSLFAHSLKLKKSEFLGASFFQGTEECWGELIGLLSNHNLMSNQGALQKANELSLDLHKFHQILGVESSSTKLLLDHWNPFNQAIDELRTLLAGQKEIGLQQLKRLAGVLSLLFFALTILSLFSKRRNSMSIRVSKNIESNEEMRPEVEVVAVAADEATEATEESKDVPITVNPEVESEHDFESRLKAYSKTGPDFEHSVQTEVHESAQASTIQALKSEQVAESIDSITQKEQTNLTIGQYLERVLQDQSEQLFHDGVLVKTEIIKDFTLAQDVEAFQNGLFYLLQLHTAQNQIIGKTIQITLRESAGQICLAIQSFPVQSWDGENINLRLATEAMKDAGHTLDWDISFLGTQSTLLTTCRSVIVTQQSQRDSANSSGKLSRLIRGKKAQIQQRLRDVNH